MEGITDGKPRSGKVLEVTYGKQSLNACMQSNMLPLCSLALDMCTQSKVQSLWAADGEATTKNVGTCIGPAEPITCTDAQCTNSLILYLEKQNTMSSPAIGGVTS